VGEPSGIVINFAGCEGQPYSWVCRERGEREEKR
jgi:hypothetical protein